ncbi:hypothetical protein GCM10007147_00620 [Nocardiopsis kunsanensis]|uniref:Uncharacterized protein n=1 Tax=Nocardiopsis kunsanensis TaxID=141693 RepID=A0A918X6N4_9ACTN|nr:hypothetical protein GCM10007147_00620 [Nocardiopsis kunsanensis]
MPERLPVPADGHGGDARPSVPVRGRPGVVPLPGRVRVFPGPVRPSASVRGDPGPGWCRTA